jgi:hypothetical protein
MSMVEILDRLESHIFSWEEDHARWCCGITSDPEQAEREVAGGGWQCYETASELEARQLEIMLRQEGCQGIPHPGGEDARFIYVFLNPPRGLH